MSVKDALRRVVISALKWVLVVVIALVVAEVAVRAVYATRGFVVSDDPEPYVYGHTYAHFPPWVDSMRLLEYDRRLFWKMRPGISRDFVDVFSPAPSNEEWLSAGKEFFPTRPDWAKDNPVFHLSVNSDGFRDEELRELDPGASFRVVCIGASWTFGSNLDQQQTYAQQLEAKLKSRLPGTDVDVVNMGVAGYSSHQGLELMRTIVLDLDPDVVVISYGGVDGQLPGWRDRDASIRNARPRARLTGFVTGLELLKLVHYAVKAMTAEDQLLGDRLRNVADRAARTRSVDLDRLLESSARVPPGEYDKNVREMIRLARERGAASVLLFTDLEGQPGLPGPLEKRYFGVLEAVSASEGVPLVDTRPIIANAQRSAQRELELRLGLAPGGEPVATGEAPRSGAGDVEVVFRVFLGDRDVPEAVFVTGTHPALADVRPNEVRMYDDGTRGDERAGDAVWSLAVRLPDGADVSYAYTNSGRAGAWEGMDVPHVRQLKVQAGDGGGRVHLPIDAFGRVFAQSDSWHPDELGHGLIADRLLEAMARSEEARGRLDALDSASSR